jgi:hypothetical protein
MLTGFSITCILVVQRNAGDIRHVLDRSLGSFTARNLAAGALAAMIAWGLGGWLRPPINAAGDFVYLCIVCGAGSVVYLVSLALFTGMSFRRLEEMWPRQDASE